MYIATLSRVKRRLEIPDSYESDDQDISDLIDGVEQEILRLTGYDLSARTRTETYNNIQLSRTFHLAYRPVSSITYTKGFYPGSTSTTWTNLSTYIVNAELGLVSLQGTTGGVAWPPVEAPANWYRNRNVTFSIVEVQYVTSAKSIDKDLIDAVVALCAYRWRRGRAGAASSSSLGGASESLMDEAIPSWVNAQLAPHIREGILWCL